MAWLVIHADRAATVLADEPILPGGELLHARDGLALLDEARTVRREAGDHAKAEAAKARAVGHAEGHAAGLEAALAEQQALLFNLSVRAAEERRALRSDIVALSIEIVRRIAGSLGTETMVAAIADRAAAEMLPDAPATLSVHPANAAAVRARLARRPAVTVETDESLSPTECILDTGLGQVRAGLETQLAAIREAMAQEGDDGR